jgi:hypothetical protein
MGVANHIHQNTGPRRAHGHRVHSRPVREIFFFFCDYDIELLLVVLATQ